MNTLECNILQTYTQITTVSAFSLLPQQVVMTAAISPMQNKADSLFSISVEKCSDRFPFDYTDSCQVQ